jgi:hypothetical protein
LFFDLRWRWQVYDSVLTDPVPFCPYCDYQIHPHRASAYAVVPRIGFDCDSCRADLPTFEEDFDSLQSKVKRLVQQKMRTGAWVNARTFRSEQKE